MNSTNRPSRCKWFALCENDATTTRTHPILGAVAICERCDAKTERLDAAARRP